MSFIETRFPPELSKKAVGGPTFSTSISEQVSGKEYRNINWQNSRAKYAIAMKSLSSDDVKIINSFFYSCKGRAHSFRFKDWLDFEAKAQVIGTGDNSKKIFYLSKLYSSGTGTFTRFITKPVPSRVKIYVNNVEVTSGISIDYNSGKITFTNAPSTGVVITATFEFDIAVRFNSDELKIAIDSTLSNSLKEIEFVEVK